MHMTPNRLFHYQTFKEEHLVSLLSEGKLKLSRPNQFNDPWDCRVHYHAPTDPAGVERRLLPLAPAPPMVVAGPAWDRLTAGQMLQLCSYGEQMENRSANVAGGVRRSVSRPGGVRPLPRREAVAGWFCLPRLRRLQGLGA